MFKLTQAALLFGLLVAHGTYLCCAESQHSEEDLETDGEEISNDGQDLRQRSEEEFMRSPCYQDVRQMNVAFFVGLSKNFGPVSHVSDIIFDNVLTNIGLGYSEHTGHFKAPVDGAYQFNINVAAQHNKQAAVALVKNRVVLFLVSSEAQPNWATGSNVAILSLKAGDMVWLQVGHYRSQTTLHGLMQTTFSGFLIFENWIQQHKGRRHSEQKSRG